MKRSMGMIGLALIAGVTVVAQDTAARACSCGFDFDIIAPRPGQIVPTNALIWMRYLDFSSDQEPEGALTGPGDPTIVEVRQFQADTGHTVRVFVPSALEPGATYTFSATHEFSGPLEVTFTVGDEADTEAPLVPQVTRCTEQAEEDSLFGGAVSSCGENHRMDIEVSAPQTALVVARRSGAPELDADAMDGGVSAAAAVAVDGDASFFLGSSPCQGTNWNGGDGDSTRMKVAAFDIAGNFSGWSGDHEVAFGCEGAPGPVRAAPILLALLALWGVARRRSP